MHLVIIIPCLNEEKTIGRVITDIPQKIEGVSDIEVVVINDGSSDNTESIAIENGAHVISHIKPMGVGAAFHSGISEAIKMGADLVVNMDGDGQFNPQDIPSLLAPVIERKADFVTASRFMDKSLFPDMPWVKKWGNVQMARLISFLVGGKFYDVSCGFRAYSKDTILRMNLFGRFTYTQETFLDLAFKGMNIREVPLKIRGEREFGKSRVASNILRYAVNSSKIIVRSFRDYRPFRFFSLLAMILFIVSSFLGAFFLYHYSVTGQFTGQLWAGFSSGFFLLFSLLFFITGLIGDMIARIRNNQEKLLYYEKLKIYGSGKDEI